MEIIKQRQRIECVEYQRVFDYRGKTDWGFSFPCDAAGTIGELPSAARANLERCLSGELAVVDRGIRSIAWSYEDPAIGRCPCGDHVVLDGFTNSCGCGRDFNMSGQELAPREQWGEETGEQAADILVGGSHDY